MKLETIQQNGQTVAVMTSGTPVMTDVQSALDLLMTARYEAGTNRIAIEKAAVSEDFFVLSTRLAGEILQKFINYQGKLAVYGDFSRYTSKPLRDFIYESNRGRDVFFVETKEEAVERLASAK